MNRSKLALLGAALIVVAGAAAGCAATPTEPEPAEVGKVSTIEEVRDAFIAAGGVCNWEQDDVVTDATASGTCSEQTVIMLFADPEDKEKVVDRLGGMTIVDVSLLVGENWVINSPEAEAMQAQLGGEVIAHEAD